MRGTHFAVIASIVVWGFGYFLSIYFFSYKYSNGIMPKKIRESTNIKPITYLFAGFTLISPFLTGLIYKIGGILEKGNGISWGCYIEDFWIGAVILWGGSFLILSILFLISILKPKVFGFENRKKAFLLFFTHNLYTLLLIVLLGFLIPILSGPLSGKYWSCM